MGTRVWRRVSGRMRKSWCRLDVDMKVVIVVSVDISVIW
jgi:hypothetical protein